MPLKRPLGDIVQYHDAPEAVGKHEIELVIVVRLQAVASRLGHASPYAALSGARAAATSVSRRALRACVSRVSRASRATRGPSTAPTAAATRTCPARLASVPADRKSVV